VCGLLVVGAWYTVLQQMTDAQVSRNDFLQAEIARLDGADQGHRHAARRDRGPEGAAEGGRRPADRPQRARAPARRTGAADARRRVPHLASSRPAQVVAVTGVAQTNERVSEFLRNTLYNSGLAGAARADRDQAPPT
jgi:type IV pilus assembly protein PilN